MVSSVAAETGVEAPGIQRLARWASVIGRIAIGAVFV